MSTTIYNRDEFLTNLANKLGRERSKEPVTRPKLKYSCHHEVMANFNQQELSLWLLEYAKSSLGVLAIECTQAELSDSLERICTNYDAGKIVLSSDPRMKALNVFDSLKAQFDDVYCWDVEQSYQNNIAQAEKAKVGIVYAEQALAESGTMVLHSNPEQGRAISLLPEASVFIIPQSKIVPRMTQAASELHQMAQRGERLPSCVNFISGPSSTADIELIKVVGVHGPVHAAYVVVSDL
ncbi:lactate utilization protein C [Vibrio sp. Of7-15]|uniref:LutC/YkgG family protein n=1 Tax=Vibrio sp. Of7-15 TaxID=2724879 RepID=UPI001EF2E580|nr:lactate utilization protein C [Vibrio sp. Of7-15]MCG7499414.1 lactate utilization protein C [Vibrio sp. Of7-15]